MRGVFVRFTSVLLFTTAREDCLKVIKRNVRACQTGSHGKSAVRGDGLVVTVEMSRNEAFLTA